MASVLVRRVCPRLHFHLSNYTPRTSNLYIQQKARAIHSSSVALKKKGAQPAAQDDAFDGFDNGEEVDMFSDLSPSPPPQATSTLGDAPISPNTSTKRTKRRHLLLFSKHRSSTQAQKFSQLYSFAESRVGKKDSRKSPQLKKSAWDHLVRLSKDEGELRKVIDLFVKWKETQGVPRDTFAGSFAKRCEEFDCPDFALEVFGNYAKYLLPMTLPAARQLLHSYHTTPTTLAPLSDPETMNTLKRPKPNMAKLLSVSQLYSVYNLPPASHDLVSCSLIASACMLSSGMNTKAASNVNANASVKEEQKKSGQEHDALVLGDEMMKFLKQRINTFEAIKARRDAMKAAATTPATSSSHRTSAPEDAAKAASPAKPRSRSRESMALKDTQGIKWVNWALHNIQSVFSRRFGADSKEVEWINKARVAFG